MAVLVTGGTGKTSSLLAALLQKANIPFLLTIRRDGANIPAEMSTVKFDWTDPSTYVNPFREKIRITAIYLVAPDGPQPYILMNQFIDFAFKEHGVKRFVLMGGSHGPGEGEHVGKVWQRLLDLGVEYCVLRPTWFMENLTAPTPPAVQFLPAIKQQRKIFTATGDAKIAFVSAIDIARVAYHGLVDEEPHNRDYRINGPEMLTYDEVAAKITNILGVKVEHVKLTEEERAKNMIEMGTPEPYAKFIASIEAVQALVPTGEEVIGSDVEKATGQRPQSFDSFIQEHKAAWQ